jgi:pimeloyl-ACP methyl ester carboxylesterase
MEEKAPPTEAWSDWGGDGPPLVFAHANGFPPATYRRLLQGLSGDFRVAAFAARPLWPESSPYDVSSWGDLADDLQRAMRRRGLERVIAVGHSLGGVLSILAAANDPGLFSALALVDPVVFARFQTLFWGTLKNFGIGHRLPLIRGARRRRDRFPDLDAVRAAYAGKSVFSTWDPRVLDDYVQAAFRDVGNGEVVLRYSKAWEARIFELTPASVWKDLRRVSVPMLVVHGALSDTFIVGAANRVRREVPNATVVELPDVTHFLPMERPSEVAAAILDWYRTLDG